MSDQRDQQIDHLLTALHRRGDGSASAECLDPEVLAAWMDGTLDAPALARAEAHAAGCAHCQAMLAAMATAETATVRTDGASPRPAFWRILPWAGPLAAAAAAATMYVAVRPAPVSQVSAPVTWSSETRQEAVEPSDRVRENPPRTGVEADAAAAPREAERAAQFGYQASPPPLPETRDLSSRDFQDAAKPVVPPPAPAPVARFDVRAQKAAQAQAAVETLQESVMLAPLLIATPDPAVRWRITGGLVQISRDGGTTWAAQDMGVQAVLTAGAAPAPAVCWIVGRGGTVLRTTDAATWQRIQFPEPVDLVRVTATSADAATVLTADGRTFVTADGGATWKR